MEVHEHDSAWADAFAAERGRLELAAVGYEWTPHRPEAHREHGNDLKPDERLDPAVLARRR